MMRNTAVGGERELCAHELREAREQTLAQFAERRGVAYAPIPNDPVGLYWVTYEGALVGEAWTTSADLFSDWYARCGLRVESEVCGTMVGPHLTARMAAAALCRHTAGHAEPDRSAEQSSEGG